MKALIAASLALVLCWGSASATQAAAEQPLQAVFAQMRKHGPDTASFIEVRKLGELDLPIESRGKLRFEPPATLIKETTQPVHEILQLSGDSLSVTIGDTSRELPLDAVPAAAALAGALRGLLGGNLAEVQQHFGVQFQGTTDNWQLKLTPTNPEVAASMKSLRVSGRGPRMDQFDLIQANGDESFMRILDQ